MRRALGTIQLKKTRAATALFSRSDTLGTINLLKQEREREAANTRGHHGEYHFRPVRVLKDTRLDALLTFDFRERVVPRTANPAGRRALTLSLSLVRAHRVIHAEERRRRRYRQMRARRKACQLLNVVARYGRDSLWFLRLSNALEVMPESTPRFCRTSNSSSPRVVVPVRTIPREIKEASSRKKAHSVC
jgi:hypothetical protein